MDICLFVQYTTSLSSLCKLIWRNWTYRMPVRYILSSVWVRLSIFSPLSIIQYMGLYVFSLPISLVIIERIFILCLIIIIKSEVWTINLCLGLDHETMVSAVCLSIFLWSFCLIEHAHNGPRNSLVYFQVKCIKFGANVDLNGFNIYDRHFFAIFARFPTSRIENYH